ncbi:melatonin receptor type 1C-like [Bolinopsis microptera]|uniref:melatonin receptor type 1C-like n=1 Tax=Bolinopsis microptera TaxID=2820187 RepID=UPI00307AA130
MKYDNYTLYGIHSKTERGLLIGYNSFIFTSSVIGDTLILIGSLRYNAIKLHKVMVTFIQHLAVVDLLLVVFTIVPVAVSLAANGWILGDILCNLSHFANVYFSSVGFLLISVLAVSKTLIVKFPLRAISVSSKTAQSAACGIWLYSLVLIIVTISTGNLGQGGAYFNYLHYDCGIPGTTVFNTVYIVPVLISTVVTMASSVMLIVMVRRIADRRPGGLQWQGVLTVLLTVAVHTAATLPLEIFYIVPSFDGYIPLGRAAWQIAALDLVGNFYIYSLTLYSFREFLKSRMKMISAPLVRCWAGTEGERSAEEGERRRLL